MFGIAALIGPIVGPTLGGWLVVNYNWRWIFYVNIPVGLLALVAPASWSKIPNTSKRNGPSCGINR